MSSEIRGEAAEFWNRRTTPPATAKVLGWAGELLKYREGDGPDDVIADLGELRAFVAEWTIPASPSPDAQTEAHIGTARNQAP